MDIFGGKVSCCYGRAPSLEVCSENFHKVLSAIKKLMHPHRTAKARKNDTKLYNNRGSHSSWKNDNSFSSPGKVLEFYNFIKNPGKMGVNLEK